MNNVYRVIWNAALQSWVVASELTRARNKSASAKQNHSHKGKAGREHGPASGQWPLMASLSLALTSLAAPAMAQSFSVSGEGNSLDIPAGTTINVSGLLNNGVSAYQGATVTSSGPLSLNATNGAGGISILSGASGNFTDTTITVTGGYAPTGLSASGDGSRLSAQGVVVEKSSGGGWGAHVTNGATLDLSNSAATVTSITIGNYGGNAALVAYDGGKLTATGDARQLQLRTSGDNAEGAAALYEGSNISLTNVDISTSGNKAHGAKAVVGGSIDLANTTITTEGSGAIGLLASDTYITQGSGSNLTAQDVVVTTKGTGAHALSVEGRDSLIKVVDSRLATAGTGAHGAMVDKLARTDLTDTTVTTSGEAAYGLFVHGDGSRLDAQGVTVETTGLYAHGATANGNQLGRQSSSTLALSNSAANVTSITTKGEGSYGLHAAVGGTLTATGDARQLQVRTEGDSAYGAFVQRADTSMSLTNVDITTKGKGAHGARASESGTLDMVNTTVTTSGDDAFGLNAASAGHLTANNVTVTTTGAGANGADASGADSMLKLIGGSITTSGEGAKGLSATNAGHIVAKDVAVITTGSAGGLASGVDSMIEITGGSVTSGNSGSRYNGGLVATDAGRILAKDVTLTTLGKNSSGLSAYGQGRSLENGVIEFEGGSITMQDDYAVGAFAYEYGHINLTGTEITSSGQGGQGLEVYRGGTITAKDVTVTTFGDYGAGLVNLGSADPWIQFESGSIVTHGADSDGLRAEGGQINVKDTTVTAFGDRSHGLNATGGGEIRFDGGSVSTLGGFSHGLVANFFGEVIANDVTVTTSGDSAAGLLAYTLTPGYESRIELEGGSVTTSGAHATGAEAVMDGRVELNGTTVTTNGLNASGLAARSGGQVRAQNATVTTHGDDARALWATGSDSLIEVEGGTISTTGGYDGSIPGILWGARGASAEDGGTIRLTDSDIATAGQFAFGVYALSDDANDRSTVEMTGGSITTSGEKGQGAFNDANSTIRLNDVAITTSGLSAHGVYAFGENSITEITGGSISTSGVSARGVYAIADGSTTEMTNSSVSTTGNSAHGLNSSGEGSLIAADNTSVVTTGADAHAVLADDGGTVNLKQAGGKLSSAQGTTLASQAGTIDAVLDGVGIGNNGLLIDSAGGSVSLSASNMTMSGDVRADASGVANLSLFNAGWTGQASNGTDFSVDAGSRWNVTASSDVARLGNAGTIAFVAPAADDGFKTLTIKGDYAGDGGTLEMNAALGSDDSLSDRLVIEGDSSGNTFVKVKNAKGAGAQTDNGIELISVAGASEGVFEMPERAVAGLYDYQLYKGGRNTPDDGNWYLRSELSSVNPTNPPINPEIVDPPVLRPEPAAYLGNQNAALRMFQHTMHDRVGEPGLTARDDDGQGYAAWVRVQNRNLDAGTVGGQIDIDTHANVMQMGVEKQFAVGEGRVHAGVMGGYGRATTDGASNFTGHKARGEVKGTNLGIYGTWFQNAEGPNGLYVDTWAQYGRFDNTVKGDYLGREQYDSRVWSGSVEAGYAFNVHSGERNGFYVEPQAQVIYTDFSSDDVTEDNGTLVQTRKAGGTTTRLGARLYSRPLSTQHNRVQPFAAVNWWSGGNASTIAMGGDRLSRDLPKNTYEAKAGAQLELGGGWSGWGQLGYQKGSNGYRDVNGQVGVKLSW